MFRQLKQCTWNSLSTINFQIVYEFRIILPYEWQESYVSKNWSQSLYKGSTKKWEEQNFQIGKTKNSLLFIMIFLFLDYNTNTTIVNMLNQFLNHPNSFISVKPMALSENNNNNVHGYCFKDTLLISITLHKRIQVFGTKPTKHNITY